MLSIDLGIGLTSIAVAVRQATNYATTWPFSTYAQANNGALPGPWADVRRTGTATYENASGVITTLPDLGGGTYAARVQYRSGTARGLLIEGQATQLLGQTEDFSDSYWGKNSGAISANAAVAPDGATTADKLVAVASATQQWVYKAGISVTSGAKYTISCFAKLAEYRYFQLRILTGGTIANVGVDLQTGATFGTIIGEHTVVAAGNGYYRIAVTGTTTGTSAEVYLNVSDVPSLSNNFTGDGVSGVYIWGANLNAGPLSSYIPNSGTGSVVRAADSAGVFLTSTALSAAFPGGVGQPWTTVFQYIKGYSVSSDETLFALSAGSSAGSTNLLALQTNGTQAQAVHSGGSGTLSGTLVHDGATVNKVAVSVDPVSGKVSVSVNGAASVETTGIAFTGSGTTHLIPGARTTGGDTPVAAMEIYDWRNVNTSYTTGASLQALSA